MNWLAHLLLSDRTADCLMGNLLPDFLRRAELQALPRDFSRGIQQHLLIDAFTDSHPIVMQSRRRLPAPYRRYGGIVIDMFYDHLLAAGWQRYAAVTLDEFTAEVYASLQTRCDCLPPFVSERLERMMSEDWLGSYREPANLRLALQRIGGRLSRPVDLGGAVDALEAERVAFTQDFDEFFPQLQRHVAEKQTL